MIQTIIVHGDLHGQTHGILERLCKDGAIRLSEKNLALHKKISKSSCIEQYHQAFLQLKQAQKYERNAKTEEEEELASCICAQKESLLDILEEKINEELAAMPTIYASIEVVDKEKFRLFLGDDVSDRGYCDLFTLQLFFALKSKGLNFTILLSNHGLELLYAFLNNQWGLERNFLLNDWDCTRSMMNLKCLLQYQFINLRQLQPLLASWKSSLELLDYFWNENTVTKCTHAPTGLETIKALAKTFGVPYQDATRNKLCNTLDAIKNAFKISLDKNRNDPTSFVQLITLESAQYDAHHSDKIFPLLAIINNRDYEYLEYQSPNESYQLDNLNGHHMPQKNQQAVTESLDNYWRKEIACLGFYKFLKIEIILCDKNTVITQNSMEMGTLYVYALEENIVGYHGCLSSGIFQYQKNLGELPLPPHYFMGAIHSSEISGEGFMQKLKEELWKKSPVVALEIIPVVFDLIPEMTYKIVEDCYCSTVARPTDDEKFRQNKRRRIGDNTSICSANFQSSLYAVKAANDTLTQQRKGLANVTNLINDRTVCV